MSSRPVVRWLVAGVMMVGAWFVSAGPPAQATIVRGFSLGSMTVAAQSIVRGVVVDQEVVYDARWGRVYTHSMVEVTRSTWGVEQPGDIIVVRQIGGTLDGVTTAVVGTARIDLGDDVVVYARTDGELHYLVGMAQGIYHVGSAAAVPTVSRGGASMEGLGFLPTVGPVQRRAADHMTLETLLDVTTQTLQSIGRLP